MTALISGRKSVAYFLLTGVLKFSAKQTLSILKSVFANSRKD